VSSGVPRQIPILGLVRRYTVQKSKCCCWCRLQRNAPFISLLSWTEDGLKWLGAHDEGSANHSIALTLRAWPQSVPSGERENVPLSHPFVERLIGTVRREYLDHILFWTTADLENKLLDFRTYFNNHRTHDSLEGRTPDTSVSRPIANLRSIRWQPHCRALYQTPAAA